MFFYKKMRKVLFWILMVILLCLLIVLGVSFWTNRTPLNVLKDWAGTNSASVQVEEIEEPQTETGAINSWDEVTKREIIRQRLEAQRNRIQTTQSGSASSAITGDTAASSATTTTSSTQTKPSTPTSVDKENKAAQDFVNNLIVE